MSLHLSPAQPQGQALPLHQVVRSVPPWRLALTAERPLWLLLLLSGALGVAFCLSLFDRGFLAGTSAFWRDPHGVIDSSWADMSTALSGYTYFIHDRWRLPLFQVGRLGGPSGSNIIFTDSTPVVALLGRAVFQATGRSINLFGGWVVVCFAGGAMSMTLLVARLGARSLLAALASTVFALSTPALLTRWGHTTLMAQFEVTLALALYVDAARAPRALPALLWALPLCALALWTHAYLFVMVLPIAAAAILKAVLDGRVRPAPAACLAGGLAGLLAIMFVLSGYLSAAGQLSALGYGWYSTNLLSPIFPDVGLLAHALSKPRLDATGGQTEGECYLGAGMLLLLLCDRHRLARQCRDGFGRHACLGVVLLGFTAFAVSNQVFIGGLSIHIPLPAAVLSAAGIFRASGRFIWPVMYLVMALGIAGYAGTTQRGRAGLMLLLCAMALQWVDAMPSRRALARTTTEALVLPVNAEAWEGALRRHASLRVLPAFQCLGALPPLLTRGLMQLQLMAGRHDVRTNSLYSARSDHACSTVSGAPKPDELTLVWLGDTKSPLALAPGLPCTIGHDAAVCSLRLSEAERRALLPDRDLTPTEVNGLP